MKAAEESGEVLRYVGSYDAESGVCQVRRITVCVRVCVCVEGKAVVKGGLWRRAVS